VITKLHQAWEVGAKTGEVQQAFDNISGNLRVNTPQQFADFIRAENKRWGDLIRKLGIKLNPLSRLRRLPPGDDAFAARRLLLASLSWALPVFGAAPLALPLAPSGRGGKSAPRNR
jgi:hypothetical protein